jgi:hypothetical protein
VPSRPVEPPGDLSLLLGLVLDHRRAILRVIATMATIVVAGVVILTLLEVPIAPWARSFGLWPTLTGEWHGEMRTPDGRVQPVHLRIGGGMRLGGRGRPYIDGLARVCAGAGVVREYVLWGRPANWRGTRFSLSMSRDAEEDSAYGPGDLQGEWQGDEIRATGTWIVRGPTATASVTRSEGVASPPPEVRYQLRRGGQEAFLAACGAK